MDLTPPSGSVSLAMWLGKSVCNFHPQSSTSVFLGIKLDVNLTKILSVICLVSFFMIRLAHKALCSEKLDQWLCEKLWTPAVFAAFAVFLFLKFLCPLATSFCFFVLPWSGFVSEPGPSSDVVGHTRTILQGSVNSALRLLTLAQCPQWHFHYNSVLCSK